MKFIEKLGILPVILIAVCIFMIMGVRHHPRPATADAVGKTAGGASSGLMNYTATPATPAATATCYSEPQYTAYIAQGRRDRQLHLTGTATETDGHHLEIYAGADAAFTILSVGTDHAGQFEACEVASGVNLQLLAGTAPLPAVSAPQIVPVSAPR